MERATITLNNYQLEWIKWVALIAMVIDHIDWVVFQRSLVWPTLIGRIAFPLFLFIILYRLFEDPSKSKGYIKSLLIWLPIAEIAHQWAAFSITGELSQKLSIFTTLLLAVLAFHYLTKNNPLSFIMTILIASVSIFLEDWTSYGTTAIFIATMGLIFIRDFSDCLIRAGVISAGILLILASQINDYTTFVIFMASAMFFPVILFSLNKKIHRMPKWFFYGFYPIHLIALSLATI
ncbi:MAG: hypothetical protein IBX55_00295 [Methyloprofundus sp.]|nr:hypothetical protein [Methyloprofundus sp.]